METLYAHCITGQGEKLKLVEVDLDHIASDDINPRIGGLVESNLEKLRGAVGEFDAIHLGLLDNKLIIADGYHRTHITREAGHGKILAYIKKYDSLDDLKKAAFRANVIHGERLNEADIAFNLFNFYMSNLAVNATIKKGTIGKEYGMTNDRQIRTYINWGIVSLECLEHESLTEIEKSKAEELYILCKDEVAGEISEETKSKMKQVFLTYGSESKAVIREASKLAKDGKDYYEEQAKVEEAEAASAKAAREESAEKIDAGDAIDRNGVADYTLGEVTGASEGSEEGVASGIIDDIVGAAAANIDTPSEAEVTETIEKNEEKLKKETKAFRPILEASSENIKGLYMLITSKTEIDINPGDVEVVDDLINVLTDIRETCFPEAATKKEEVERAFL